MHISRVLDHRNPSPSDQYQYPLKLRTSTMLESRLLSSICDQSGCEFSHQERSRCVLMYVSVREHRALND